MEKRDYGFLQETCEIVSKLFKVVITIINSDYVRVAGTDLYRHEIGKLVANSNVFKSVMENNKTIIINNPRQDPECARCENKEACSEKAAIYTPIHVRDRIWGAIGIIAFSDEQRENGPFGEDIFVSFTKMLCDLLSSKIETSIYEEELQESLNEAFVIFNTVHDGVIAINDQFCITRANHSAKKKFGIDDSYINAHAGEILPDSLINRIREKGEIIDSEVVVHGAQGEINALVTAKKIEGEGRSRGWIISMKSFLEAASIASKVVHEADYKVNFTDIIGESKVIRDVIAFSEKISDSDSTVLIRGESGTGKELFARAIHNNSNRRMGPFVAINCGAIPEALLESELFGYEDGAFTGAKKGGKIGKCQLANGGTLFLDEVGDIPIFLQVKFLRMLQERVIEKVGGSKSTPIDIRVIAATNRNLEEMIKNNEFRSDLYYRLNVIPIFIPPLRERKEDIPIISNFFLKKYSELLRKNVVSMTTSAERTLCSYSWPGNIRELENTIECAMNIENNDILTSGSLPERIRNEEPVSGLELFSTSTAEIQKEKQQVLKAKNHRRKIDIKEVLAALDKYGWDTGGKKQAAKSLNIGIATLYRILNDYQSR